ncbi:hypothetical protein EW146_g7333 [Bondarzewia mesenterica]|uniref:DNA repair metallo-beta-lactamase domain-containing protein n=1 Tax=Bondarzewia mesenterica TaxID=1095465 RepID=A0A4S4LL74_9AGAM|nr:hypothetical protein EW146_g7333 [Bondarzewia mesenterica]
MLEPVGRCIISLRADEVLVSAPVRAEPCTDAYSGVWIARLFMAPASAAKKRSENTRPESVTLHHFFSKALSTNKDAPSSKLPGPKLPRPTVNLKGKRRAFVPPPEADIIVIDSDEDEPHSSTSRSKRKHDSASSDVEVLDASDVPQAGSHSSLDGKNKKVKKEQDRDDLMFGALSPASQEFLLPWVEMDEVISFGQPTNLLRFSSSSSSNVSDCALPRSNKSSAHPPHLPQTPSSPISSGHPPQGGPLFSGSVLARPPSLPAEPPNPTPDPTNAKSPIARHENAVAEVDDIAEIDDEWGMGDDELAQDNGSLDAFDVNDDDAVEDIIELDSSPDESVDMCPVCGKKLKGLFSIEIEDHVNKCADAQVSVPSHVPSTNSASKVKGSADVFSVLMSSHKENEAWREATVAEDRNFRPTKGNGGRRKAPFYKVMQGMPIAVDAFRYGAIPGITAYFLTHAHSDHYTNLSSNWKAGPIYCSRRLSFFFGFFFLIVIDVSFHLCSVEGTANLIIHMLSVDPKWVHSLPMDTPITVPDSGGVSVTLIEANHCPGSSLFLFEGPQTVNAGDSAFKSPFVGSSKLFRYLHCGDFRASPQHVLHPAIKGKHLDVIYLDTTYLNPKYCFPSQAQVISACAELARRIISGDNVTNGENVHGKREQTVDKWFTVRPKLEDKGDPASNRTVVVVGTYSIGKERIVKAIAKALHTKIYCDSRKTAYLRCQSDHELHSMLTNDPFEAGVHLVPLSVVNSDRIKEYTERWKGYYKRAIGFRPTGWTYTPPVGTVASLNVATILSRQPHPSFTHAHLKPMRGSTATHQMFGVPYSEHSSFFELTCFAVSLHWTRIIATVNVGNEASRGKIAAWVAKWEAERKKRGGFNAEIVPYRTVDYW